MIWSPVREQIRVVTGRSRAESRSQVDRADRAWKTRRPGATAAMIVRPRAVVIHRVELAVHVESRRAQPALDGIAQIDSVGRQLSVRFGEPMERNVDLASGGIDLEPPAARLSAQPALKVGHRRRGRPVRVQRAIGAIARECIDQVNLGSGEVVGPIGRRAGHDAAADPDVSKATKISAAVPATSAIGANSFRTIGLEVWTLPGGSQTRGLALRR